MKKSFCLLLLTISLAVQAQPEYVTEKNIAYYTDSISRKDAYLASQCRLDFYYPKGVKDFATIVWFHGGGITGGAREIPAALMAKGYAVIGVGYRLSPKVSAPAYIEDAAAALAWVFAHIGEYGGSKRLIFLSGHSAGAYLGLMITLDKKYMARYRIDPDSLAAVIPFSSQTITHFTVRKERGIPEKQPVIDEYAPLFHMRSGVPPMLIITGDREMELLGRYEENAYLWRMMQLNGNKRTVLYELDGFDHGGMAQPAFPLLLKEVATRTREIKP